MFWWRFLSLNFFFFLYRCYYFFRNLGYLLSKLYFWQTILNWRIWTVFIKTFPRGKEKYTFKFILRLTKGKDPKVARQGEEEKNKVAPIVADPHWGNSPTRQNLYNCNPSLLVTVTFESNHAVLKNTFILSLFVTIKAVRRCLVMHNVGE